MSVTLTGMATGVRMRGLQYKNRGYLFNGRNRMRTFDGVGYANAGIERDITVPTGAAGAAGSLSGRYRYLIAPINSKKFTPAGRYVQGIPNPISAEISLTNTVCTLTLPSSHADSQVDYWAIYRNRANVYKTNVAPDVQMFYYVAKVAVAAATYSDVATDDSLDSNDLIRWDQNIPPTFKHGAMFGERMFGIGFDPITDGTATVNGTTTLMDFAGVVLPDGILGCWFKKDGDDKAYVITARAAGGTQITLSESFVGTCSAAAYHIYRYPWEIYFSEYEDPEGWGPLGEGYRYKLELPGRDHATGLFAMPNGSQLLVFSREKIFSIQGQGPNRGDVTMSPQPIFSGLGCVGGDAIDSIDNDLYFLSLEGLCVMPGGGVPQVISRPLNTDWIDDLDDGELALCAVGCTPRSVYLAAPYAGETENRRVWRFDRITQSWWPEDNGHPSFFVHDDGDNGVVGKLHFAQGKSLFESEKGSTDVAATLYSGTITTGGSNTFTHATATFPTTNGGLVEAYAHIFRAGVYIGKMRITSNTATSVTSTQAYNAAGVAATLTIAVGDTYKIGAIWWKWTTRHFEIPAHVTRVLKAKVSVGAVDATKNLRKTDIVDGTEGLEHAVTGAVIGREFEVNKRPHDFAMRLESYDGATLRHVTLDVEQKETK